MARLIDADAAKIRFANYREDCINEDDINAANVFADVVSELDEFPTIDPVTAAAEALGMSPDRLRELAQAEKEGRLVVLPCDVGDKLYDVTLGEVREKIVISLSMLLSKSVNHLVIHAENFRNAVTSYELQDIGKTVFLTREAAEAALKEREAEHESNV